jgi:hypothetical protein
MLEQGSTKQIDGNQIEAINQTVKLKLNSSNTRNEKSRFFWKIYKNPRKFDLLKFSQAPATSTLRPSGRSRRRRPRAVDVATVAGAGGAIGGVGAVVVVAEIRGPDVEVRDYYHYRDSRARRGGEGL